MKLIEEITIKIEKIFKKTSTKIEDDKFEVFDFNDED